MRAWWLNANMFVNNDKVREREKCINFVFPTAEYHFFEWSIIQFGINLHTVQEKYMDVVADQQLWKS